MDLRFQILAFEMFGFRAKFPAILALYCNLYLGHSSAGRILLVHFALPRGISAHNTMVSHHIDYRAGRMLMVLVIG